MKPTVTQRRNPLLIPRFLTRNDKFGARIQSFPDESKN